MSNTRNHRIAATAALSIGVLSLVVTTILQWTVQPAGDSTTPADVAEQFPTVWTITALLAVFGPAIWVGAMPAVGAMGRGRGSVPVTIGAAVTGLGLVIGVGHLALFFGLFGTVAAAGVDNTDVTRLAAGSDADPLTAVLLFVFLVAFSVGPILLTVGLRISRVVPVWVPVAALVTSVASMFGGSVAGIVQLIALLLTWAPVAVGIVRGGPERPAVAVTAGSIAAG
jgi:hypothetical protein